LQYNLSSAKYQDEFDIIFKDAKVDFEEEVSALWQDTRGRLLAKNQKSRVILESLQNYS